MRIALLRDDIARMCHMSWDFGEYYLKSVGFIDENTYDKESRSIAYLCSKFKCVFSTCDVGASCWHIPTNQYTAT